MNVNERKNWLCKLKIGDEVRILCLPSYREVERSKIKNITKSNKFRIENGKLFNTDGNRNSVDGYEMIYPIEKN